MSGEIPSARSFSPQLDSYSTPEQQVAEEAEFRDKYGIGLNIRSVNGNEQGGMKGNKQASFHQESGAADGHYEQPRQISEQTPRPIPKPRKITESVRANLANVSKNCYLNLYLTCYHMLNRETSLMGLSQEQYVKAFIDDLSKFNPQERNVFYNQLREEVKNGGQSELALNCQILLEALEQPVPVETGQPSYPPQSELPTYDQSQMHYLGSTAQTQGVQPISGDGRHSDTPTPALPQAGKQLYQATRTQEDAFLKNTLPRLLEPIDSSQIWIDFSQRMLDKFYREYARRLPEGMCWNDIDKANTEEFVHCLQKIHASEGTSEDGIFKIFVEITMNETGPELEALQLAIKNIGTTEPTVADSNEPLKTIRPRQVDAVAVSDQSLETIKPRQVNDVAVSEQPVKTIKPQQVDAVAKPVTLPISHRVSDQRVKWVAMKEGFLSCSALNRPALVAIKQNDESSKAFYSAVLTEKTREGCTYQHAVFSVVNRQLLGGDTQFYDIMECWLKKQFENPNDSTSNLETLMEAYYGTDEALGDKTKKQELQVRALLTYTGHIDLTVHKNVFEDLQTDVEQIITNNSSSVAQAYVAALKQLKVLEKHLCGTTYRELEKEKVDGFDVWYSLLGCDERLKMETVLYDPKYKLPAACFLVVIMSECPSDPNTVKICNAAEKLIQDNPKPLPQPEASLKDSVTPVVKITPEREALIELQSALVSAFPFNDLLPMMISKRAISFVEKADITANRTESRRTAAYLDKLEKDLSIGDMERYTQFYQVMKSSPKCNFLVDRLDEQIALQRLKL